MIIVYIYIYYIHIKTIDIVIIDNNDDNIYDYICNYILNICIL